MSSEANTVTLSTNLNVDPYYDDFDESKNFHRILYRPGLAVQARELTAMQSILQNQIDRFAEHIFKEGSIVRGCTLDHDRNYNYVKLRNSSSTGTTVNATAFLNKTIRGTTSGVRALIVNTTLGSEANTPDFKTFFVKYTAANTAGRRFFSNNEILTTTDGSALSANTIRSAQGAATGFGSAVKISAGIIFAKDHFIKVSEQTLILDKFSANGNYRVGLDVVESIVREGDDTSLLDPASGSYNYAAPGATRLKIVATLTKKTFTATTANNFIELAQIKDGVIQTRNDITQYSMIRDYMAKRTSDESGDYIVRGFSVGLREHLNSANNQGVLTAAEGGLANNLFVDIQPGRAYVQGYDVERIGTTRVAIPKGIDYASIEQVNTLMDYGNYLIVDNIAGNWDVNDQSTVTLRSQQANAVSTINYSLTAIPGSSLGTARVRGIEYYSGTPGLPSAQYKLYLTDIRLTSGSFANVQSIGYSAGVGFANGKADILGATGYNANTQDSSFDIAVFPLPTTSTRTLRDTSSVVDTDFTFYKSFPVTFNVSGVATLTTGDSSERLSGTGTLSDAAVRSNYHIISRGTANTNTLTGTISVTASGNTVTGSGSAFDTQVNPGDILRIGQGANNNLFLVSVVTNATSLKVHSAFTSTRAAIRMCKQFKPGQVIDLGGVGRDGVRTVVISGSPATTSTIDMNETLNANSSSTLAATVIVKLSKADGQEATKTINRARLVQVRIGSGGGTSYVGNTTGPWPLGLSDGFKITSVRIKSGSNFAATSEGSDVTSNFTLDTGMRDNLYDHSRLVKKSTSGITIASGDRLLVTLDYFTHANRERGYFSIDSYPVNDSTAGTDTTKIYTYQVPIFTSPSDGSSYNLRDSIDIRPRVTDTANSVTAITNVSINPLTGTALDAASGGLHFGPPQTNFTCDLDYYLSRRDLIVMSKNGTPRAIRGVPAVAPRTPFAPDDVIALASIYVVPYPSLSAETARRNDRPDLANSIVPIKNDRFTMKDIGAIRDRVDRLEYYTSLSLLEMDAKELSITTSAGLDRFKNGIIVDSFKGHNIGNVFDLDYKIAIDAVKGEARPPFALNNIELFYIAASSTNVVRTNVTPAGVSKDQVVFIANTQVIFSNTEILTSGASTATLRYQVNNKLYIEAATGNFAALGTVTGGTSGRSTTIVSVTATTPGELVTLPYTHEIMVNQKYSTTTRNVSGLYYNWAGVLTLNPQTDYWVDTTNQPNVQINFDGIADNWTNLDNSWQTQWGDWKTISEHTVITSSSESTSPGDQYRGRTQIIGLYTTAQQAYTTTENQTRTGIKPVPNPTSSDENVSGFIRSRPIQFTGQGLKPSTRLYAFFDGTAVSTYITPMNSSFANTALEGAQLYTDTSGNVYGQFRIPNDTSMRFRTGDRILRLTDNPTNAQGLGLTITSAQSTYIARNATAGTDGGVYSTRNAEVSFITVTEERTVMSSGVSVKPGTFQPLYEISDPTGYGGSSG